jgi:chromosome segregation ATPase
MSDSGEPSADARVHEAIDMIEEVLHEHVRKILELQVELKCKAEQNARQRVELAKKESKIRDLEWQLEDLQKNIG